MKVASRLALLTLLASLGGLAEETLAEKVEQVMARSKAFWGLKAVSMKTGKTLVEVNANRFFVPASNTKLFSTSLALMRLGPDYRFTTTVRKEGADIVLVGGGDPSPGARRYPYDKNEPQGDALARIRALAEQTVAAGVKTVNGDIIGDDTLWPYDPYPEGWSQNDTLFEYGAPVSALTINDNAFRITLTRSSPPAVILNPALEYYTIHNQTVRGTEGRVRYERDAGSRELRLSGVVTDRGWSDLLAIDDPALYAALALKQELERLGVAVSGVARVRHRRLNEPYVPPTGEILAQRKSPPLSELLQVTAKVSQNLHAEMMLREVGRVKQGEATARNGVKELQALLAEAGVAGNQYHFVDGSGLSRLTLVTPDTVYRLLRHMYASKYRELWISFLPIAGEDGTLISRFKNNKEEARRIHAKTGTLTHVTGLGGYVDSIQNGTVIFSLIANNYNEPTAEVRKAMDDIAFLLAE